MSNRRLNLMMSLAKAQATNQTNEPNLTVSNIFSNSLNSY